MHNLFLILISTLSLLANAGTIGSFEHVQNQPGHITSDKDAQHYEGPIFNYEDKDKTDGIDRRTPSKMIRETYLNRDGTVKVESLQKLLLDSRADAENAFLVVCQKEKKVPGAEFCALGLRSFEKDNSEASQKVFSKFNTEDQTVSRKIADAEVLRAIQLAKTLSPLVGEKNLNSQEAQEFFESLFNALDIYSSLKFQDPIFGDMFRNIGLFTKITSPQIVSGRVEASNLVDPQTGEYLSSDLLAKNGIEVSELDPKDSGFWRKPTKPISSFNTKNYDGLATDVDVSLLDPKDPVSATFAKVKVGGATPKIDVKIGKDTFKLKFDVESPRPGVASSGVDALKYYSQSTLESQTETVVNNLAAALGFTVDPTYYKETVRLFLNDKFVKGGERATNKTNFDKAHKNLVEELEQGDKLKPGQLSWNYRAALSSIKNLEEGEDAGRFYIELKGNSLEKRPDGEEEIEVGGFSKTLNGRNLKREIRGFQAFYAWVNDDDAKDANSELKLKKHRDSQGHESYKLVFSASDMGATLGWMFGKGQPNIFSGDLVDFERTDTAKGVLALKLPTYARYDIWKAVSMNDMRWGTRLIAQLTPDQIRNAFAAAGYPTYVSEVFTQKLLKRRDQLLVATGLMGSSTKAHGTGETITFKPETSLKDGVVFKVAGYEKCFDDKGNLIEYAGLCDKRWSATLNPIKDGSPEKELIDSLIYGEVPKFLEPFVRRMQRLDYMHGLTSAPAGGFFDGVAVGVDSLIPARYIIANPLAASVKGKPDSDDIKPWWIVDVFRTGYGISRAKELDTQFNTLGFELTPQDTNFDVRVSKTWEFMRIRAVRDPKEFGDGIVKEVLSPKNMFVTAMKNLSEKMVDTMRPGDVLISSTYFAPGFTVNFSPIMSATTLIGPEIKIGVSHTVTNRITILRDEKNEKPTALVNWQDLNKSELGGNISLKVFLFNFGGLRQRLAKLSSMDRLFQFDLANKDQSKLLMKSLKRTLPEFKEAQDQKLLNSLAISDKESKQKENLRSFGFLGLPTFLDYRRSQEVTVRDPQTGEIENRYLSKKKGKNTSGLLLFKANLLNSDEVSSEAMSESNGNISSRFRVDYSRSWAKSSDFQDASEKLFPLLPQSLVQFQVDSKCYYLGTLEIAGDVTYSNEALQDILGRNLSKDEGCRRFTAAIQKSVPEIPDLCVTAVDNIDALKLSERLGRTAEDRSRIRSALLATRAFTENFAAAQRAYAERGFTTLTENGKSKVQKALQKVVSLMETRPLRNHVLSTLQSLTTDSKLHRSARIFSSLGCLPNGENEIKLNKEDRGGHELTALEKSESILAYTDTQVDAVHDAVRKYFYDFLYKSSILSPRETSVVGNVGTAK